MDPVTVISLIQACAGITLSAGKLAVCLKSLASTYKHVELTIKTLSHQCKLFATAVSAIQRWMCDGPETDDLHEEVWKQLHESLEFAEDVIAALETDITPFLVSGLSHSATLKAKAVWNMQNLKEHDDRIRSQISGLQLILHIMQLPSKPKQRKSIQDEASVFEDSRESVRSLFGDGHSTRCSTIATEFDFDAQLFTSGVYKRYILVTRRRDQWNPADSVREAKSDDGYDDSSTIRTVQDTATISDQAQDTLDPVHVQAKDQDEYHHVMTYTPNGYKMLKNQPSLEWGENLMRSLDYAAKEATEMRIAEPDRKVLGVAHLTTIGLQGEVVAADINSPEKSATETVKMEGSAPEIEASQPETIRPDHTAKAATDGQAIESMDEIPTTDNHLQPQQLSVTSDQDANSDIDVDVGDAGLCKSCGEGFETGKAFELAGNRWHLDCFRCNTCSTLLDSDANLLLLGDGSLICTNCTYDCSYCKKKIEDLVVLAGHETLCTACFNCRNCKSKIENLKYARTSQGIFCMPCHDSLMLRRSKRKAKEKGKARENEAAAKAQHKTETTNGDRDPKTPKMHVRASSTSTLLEKASPKKTQNKIETTSDGLLFQNTSKRYSAASKPSKKETMASKPSAESAFNRRLSYHEELAIQASPGSPMDSDDNKTLHQTIGLAR